MAVTDEKDGVLTTAAVAAAAGVAAYGLRKALSSSGGNGSSQKSMRNHDEDEDYEYDDDDDEDGGDGISGRAGSMIRKVRGSDSKSSGSVLETIWESTSGTLMPLAEEAADTAGKWVAENSPDIVREQLVPRFIESFQDHA